MLSQMINEEINCMRDLTYKMNGKRKWKRQCKEGEKRKKKAFHEALNEIENLEKDN